MAPSSKVSWFLKHSRLLLVLPFFWIFVVMPFILGGNNFSFSDHGGGGLNYIVIGLILMIFGFGVSLLSYFPSGILKILSYASSLLILGLSYLVINRYSFDPIFGFDSKMVSVGFQAFGVLIILISGLNDFTSAPIQPAIAARSTGLPDEKKR